MRRDSENRICLLVATDLSQRLRSALDFSVVCALLMVLTAMAAGQIHKSVARSQIAEALVLFSNAKNDVVVHRAQTGEWPVDIDLATMWREDDFGRYVSHIEIGAGGALTAVFRRDTPAAALRGRFMTIRPLTIAGNPGAPVPWVCGPHRFPSDRAPNGIDRTDIAASYIPSVCKDY